MIFRLLAFLGFALAMAGNATADIGIDFKSMKRGTKFHYETSAGTRWVKTFKGKRGKYYKIDVRSVPDNKKYRRTEVYNAAGHLVRYEVKRNSNATVTYEPQHCARVIGKCAMKSSDNNVTRISSTRGLKLLTRYQYSTSLQGNSYTASIVTQRLGLSGESIKPKVKTTKSKRTATLGKFNLFVEQHWTEDGKRKWSKLVRIEE